MSRDIIIPSLPSASSSISPSLICSQNLSMSSLESLCLVVWTEQCDKSKTQSCLTDALRRGTTETSKLLFKFLMNLMSWLSFSATPLSATTHTYTYLSGGVANCDLNFSKLSVCTCVRVCVCLCVNGRFQKQYARVDLWITFSRTMLILTP